MSVVAVTKDNFDEIKSSASVVMLDFYADWCGPCRMVAPIVHEIADEREDVTVGKINVDNEPDLAQKFGVMSIPTIVVLKGGEEAARAVGVRSKQQLLDMLG
ncbi:MAG: thioredoxin [Clostridia bacterium]|nr:thioredoxin [Clostridia bacterium]